MRIQNNEGGRADKRLMFAAPFVFAAAIMLGVKLALAWVAPDVAITSPASYATLSGSVPVSVSYDVKAGNDYSVHLLVDGAVVETLDVHSKSGTIVFDWDSTMVANGAHTLVARAYSAAAPSSHYGDSVPVNVTVNNSAAPVDTDAPSLSLTSPADGATVNTASVNVSGTVSDAMSGVDTVTVNGADAIISGNSFNLNGVTLNEGQNTITVTATDNAGNSISKTISVTYTPPVVIPPACGSDSDCSDDNALTLDYCTKPGTAQAACVNTAIVCNSAADCDDNDTHTLDACTNGGTTSAACRHDNIACLNNSECNDGNALTLDNCQNPGAPQSACAHTAIACNSAADCNDGNDQTTDSCTNPGTVQSACLHTPVAQPPVEDTTTPPPADTTAPALSITSPTNGATVNVSSVNITGTVSDAGGVAWVRVNGVDAIINGNSFSLNNIELNEGANTITVTATDNSGNPAVASVEVVYAPPVVTPPVVTPPALTLDVSSPSDGLVTNNVKVAVSGTTIPGAVVTVNGAAASVGAGGAISYTGALNEGANTVTVKACANGECLTESRSVVVDTRKPDITGAEEDGADVLVYMQDNAGGTGLDEGALLVQIDGYEAAGTYDKTKKAFRAKGLALGVGSHTVTASAADRAGNVAQSAMSLNKSGGDGNVSIAIEDVPGKISGVTAAGTSAGSVYGPMPEPGVQVTGMQQAASWSFSPATTQTGNLSQPVSGGTELQKFFSELYGKTHPKWPVFAGTGESMVKNAPPKLKCSDLDKGLSDTSSGSEASVLSVDGDIVAAVDAAAGVDEGSIVVAVDGIALPVTYDKKTKKATAHAKGLKRGSHTVTVSAADMLGSTGMATTAFGVDPIVYSLTIDNETNPGSGRIAGGEIASITAVMDVDNFTGAWVNLVNSSNNTPIGREYYLNYTAPVAGGFEYATSVFFYTSRDNNGGQAAAVGAAIPLNASLTQFMYSNNSLTIDNTPVKPFFQDVHFMNFTVQGARTINAGDAYWINAGGSRGVQDVAAMLFNVDTLTGGAQNPIDAMVQSTNMIEDNYGSGNYVTDGAVLGTTTDTTGHASRALLPVVCTPGMDACALGNVLYTGQHAPVITSVLLERAGSQPGTPFTQPGQIYKITINADITPDELPYLRAVVVNAGRMPQVLAFSGINPYMAQYITNFNQVSPGIYVAEGTLDSFNDADGQQASNVEALVSTTQFLDYTISNSVSVQQAPPPPQSFSNIKISNVSAPLSMTVSVGEWIRIEADGQSGQPVMCNAKGVINYTDAVEAVRFPMTETPAGSGHYVCEGELTSRPALNGMDADFLLGYIGDSDINMADNFLTYRGGISVVHFANASHENATDIAPGDTFEITVSAIPNKNDIDGFLADAAFYHSVLGQNQVFTQFGPLEEVATGTYRITGVLGAVPQGVASLRALAGSMSDSSVAPVMSNETLTVSAAPPAAPTTIATIDGAAVQNGSVSGTSAEPVVAGTAPAGSTVNIYELTPGGSDGGMTPVVGGAAMSAVYVPDAGTYGDNFDDGIWSDKWTAIGRLGVWSLTEQNGHLAFNLGSNAQVGLDGTAFRNINYDDSAVFGLDATILPSDQTDYSGFIGISARIGGGQNTQDYNLDLYFFGGNSAQSQISLRKTGGECNAPYQALAPNSPYRLEMSFSPTGTPPRAIVRINGAEVLSCDITTTPTGQVQNVGIEAAGATTPLSIEVDNYDTGINVQGSYDISAPALSYNGVDYNFQNIGALLLDPRTGQPSWLPAHSVTSLDGETDIHAFAVTLYDFRPDPANNPDAYYSEGKLTIYSGGSNSNPALSQMDVFTAFMDQITQMGVISTYTLDASGVAFIAHGAGNPYQPVNPISTQYQICREEAGVPGYLKWDAASGKYNASYTPLVYQGTTYSDYVIWGLAQTGGDAPNLVTSPDTPIWWADGLDDVSAGAVSFFDGSKMVNATIYATAGLFAILPSNVTVYAYADRAFTTPADPGQNYGWNQAAFDAAELTSGGATTVCTGYGRSIIASTTATQAGTYSTQTASIGGDGDKLLMAESADPVTNAVKGTSGVVTYKLGAATTVVDTTPPEISGFQALPRYFSPGVSTGIKDAVSISAIITDESGFDWKLDIKNETETFVSYTGTGQVSVVWAGTSSSGAQMSEGGYTAALFVMDRSQNQNYTEATMALYVDRSAPTVQIVSPTNGSMFYPDTQSGVFSVSVHGSDNIMLDNIELYVDGVYATGVVANTAMWDGVFDIPASMFEAVGPHEVMAVASDAAGNDAIPQAIQIISEYYYARPAPPERLSAASFAGGEVSLAWLPPLKNADGGPLNPALAGYNIYAATETARCGVVSAVAGSSNPTCGAGITPGSYIMRAPALVSGGVEYDDSPSDVLGGPVWLDVTGVTGVNGMSSMRLSGIEAIEAGGAVFGYLIDLSVIGGGSLPAGQYFVTAYTQSSYDAVASWINAGIQSGKFGSATKVKAHVAVCGYNFASGTFMPQKLPLSSIPHYEFRKLNGTIVQGTSYTVPVEFLSTPWTVFSATALNIRGRESDLSGVVDQGTP